MPGSDAQLESKAGWIPLMDYAIKNGVSLSTLRRHIKARKIPFKIDHGRYLLPATSSLAAETGTGAISALAPGEMISTRAPGPASADSGRRIERLEAELQKAREEIAELKTLIAFYEENI
jgi:hypothetical protein